MTFFLEDPLFMNQDEAFDLEHNILPTDVTNHYSGFPITLTGADLWTCYGSMDESDQKYNPFWTFGSSIERRRGRCSLQSGQFPYILFWPSFF